MEAGERLGKGGERIKPAAPSFIQGRRAGAFCSRSSLYSSFVKTGGDTELPALRGVEWLWAVGVQKYIDASAALSELFG